MVYVLSAVTGKLVNKNKMNCWIKRTCVLVLGLFSYGAWAQTDSLIQQADRMAGWKAYGRAIDIYSQLLTNSGPALTATQEGTVRNGLAYAYQQVGDNKKAERVLGDWFARQSAADAQPQQVLLYAQILAWNGKFAEAQQYYERYEQVKAKQPGRSLASLSPGPVLPKQSGPKSLLPTTRYRLEYLDLNSANEEFSPMYYRDGLVYVSGSKGSSSIETTGSGGGAGYLDLFYVPNRNQLKIASVISPDGIVSKPGSERSQSERRLGADTYTAPTANDSRIVTGFEAGINISQGLGYELRPLNPAQRFSKSINTRYHEGPATFFQDGSRIIFTRNNVNARGKVSQSTEGVTKLKLYTAEQQNGTWANITELPFNSDDYSVGHPALSKDRLLFFASDMPGGLGGTDLYVSRLENGKWSKPVNLGNQINTKGNDLFPFADEAGNLYFSSDGRKGQGGLDIFYAVMNDMTVQRVETLNAPINSPQDDFGLIADAARLSGYFSSNRRDGNDDIYRFVRESSLNGCRDLTIRLFDSKTDQPLDGVTVQVKIKGEDRSDQLLQTDSNGLVNLCLNVDNEFTFVTRRDSYVSSTVGFSTQNLTDDQPSRLEIGLTKPTVRMDTIRAVTTDTWERSAKKLTRSRVRGTVFGEQNRLPIDGVTVRLRNECDNSTQQAVTKSNGQYVFDLVDGCDYTLTASKDSYGTKTSMIRRAPPKSRPKEIAADLSLLSVGDVVAIQNIYYDLDRYTLRAGFSQDLDKVVAMMQQYPSMIIEVRSHTDSQGDATYNKELSTRRAEAVADYLIYKGINRNRVSATGLGESMLLNRCKDGVTCTEAEHQRNRRTEFKVVSVK